MRISDWSSDVCSSDLSAFREYCESAQGLPASTEAAGAARHNLVIGNEGPKPLVSHAGSRSDPENNGTDVTPSFPPAGIRAEPLCEGLRVPRFLIQFGRFARQASSWATRSEEHTFELQSLLLITYAVFGLKKIKKINNI